MSQLKVDTAQVTSQASTFSDHAHLIDAERMIASAAVSAALAGANQLFEKHSASLAKEEAFLTKVTQAQSDAQRYRDNIKKKYDLAKARYDSLSRRASNASDEVKQAQQGWENSGSEEKRDKLASMRDDQRGLVDSQKIVLEQYNHLLPQLAALIAETEVEINRTSIQHRTALILISQFNAFENASLAHIGVFFRALNLGQKVSTFATAIESGDANAGSTLNSNLPTVAWLQSGEAKKLRGFFADKSAEALAVKKLGAKAGYDKNVELLGGLKAGILFNADADIKRRAANAAPIVLPPVSI